MKECDVKNFQDITPDVEFSKIKKMKEKNISMTESLTKKQMEAVKKAREGHGFGNVLSSEGKILYKNVSKRNKIKACFD